jgi:VWFA-related protein
LPDVSSTAELDHNAPQAPVSIIVLDEVNTQFTDQSFSRAALRKYLDAQGSKLHHPTMLAAVDMHHFMLLHDYTTSRNEILNALDHHLAEIPWQLSNTNRQPDQMSRVFSALTMVAEATTGHPGHKSLIWVGRGMPFIDLNAMSPDGVEQVQDAIRECTNRLQAARITLYSIDPAGLAASPPPEDDSGNLLDDPFGASIGFDNMAITTGGRAFHGRNDIDNLVDSSERETDTFYTLSYSPTSPDDPAKPFRNIRIVMRNPDLRANTRKGYYTQAPVVEPEPAANSKLPNDLVFDLTAAARSLIVYDTVPMTISRDAADPDKFHINIRAADAAWQSGSAQYLHTDLLVLAESFDRKGKMLQRNAKVYNLDLAPSADGNLPVPHDIHTSASIPTAPPAARLRIVVRIGQNGKLGAQNFYLVDKSTITDPATGLNLKSSTR